MNKHETRISVAQTSTSRVANDAHWTDLEVELLRTVTTFDEMVPIACDIINRMRQGGKEVHQLCGPMTTGGKGSLEANMKNFHRAIDVAREQGVLVFDQTPFQEAIARLVKDHDARNEYCADILHVFYRGIFKSGLISKLWFLPDWQSSKGATWEWEEAERLGLAAEEYPSDWLPFLEQ